MSPTGPGWTSAVRLLAAVTLVNAFGNGLFMVASLLYFTRVLGLSPVAVGVGLTLAEAAGLACTVPIGAAADRFGAKPMLRLLLLVQGGATLLFLLPHSVGSFVAVALLYAVGQKAGRGVNNALIAVVADVRDRTVVRARLRSVNNLGLSLGSLAAGVAVAFGTSTAYAAVFTADAATFLVAVVVLGRLDWRPPDRSAARAPTRRFVLRDLRYVRLTALNAVVSLQYSVLTVGLPLWVADHTSAPGWLVSILLAMNTAMIVLFQVRGSRRITSPRAAATYLRRGAGLFLLGVSALGCAALGGPALAVGLLLAGVVVHTVAELWHAAAAFEASVAFAPSDRHGAYQGLFALGQGIAESFAPALLVTLCLGAGVPGWLVLAAVLAVGCLLMAAWLDREEERGKELVAESPQGGRA